MKDVTKVTEVAPPIGLADSIERNSALLAGTIPRTAEIKLPSREYLSVQLVPLSMVQRVDELKSDSDLFKNVAWALVGALLGVVTTLVMSNVGVTTVDKATWTAIGALLTGIGGFTFLTMRAGAKLDKEKEKLFKIEFEKEHV